MSDIVELNSKRAPVVYTVTIAHHYDGTLEFNIADVAEDERSRESVMSAFRRISGADKEIDILRKDLRGAILSDSDYVKEIDCQNTRLRADLAAVIAERDRMREALKETLAIARRNEAGDYVDRAFAALEGVTEPASPWCDIESAPRDGTYIDLWVNDERIPDARWNDCRRQWEVWGTGDYDRMEFIPIAGNPTHWMPLPEPPSND